MKKSTCRQDLPPDNMIGCSSEEGYKQKRMGKGLSDGIGACICGDNSCAAHGRSATVCGGEENREWGVGVGKRICGLGEK